MNADEILFQVTCGTFGTFESVVVLWDHVTLTHTHSVNVLLFTYLSACAVQRFIRLSL
jgi:hypothetical protein